jgi:colanic acid biosynthesis protein WcaH
MSVWLSPEQFAAACGALPLVSVDLYLIRETTNGRELLLGRRNNHPAQGWWFTPGGRIRKNEPLLQAMRRIADDEVGATEWSLEHVQFVGVWDHFYNDSAFDAHVSTHYVNLAYWLPMSADAVSGLRLPAGIEAQHAGWQWMPLGLAAEDESVHENVRAVVRSIISNKF